MRIAYNPLTAAALTTAPANNDITFDLKGLNIFVRGVKFKGTDTTYSVFKKHTSSSGGGYNGLVPVPSYTSTNTRFLREDGSWVVPTNTDNKVTLGNTTTSNFRPIILGYNNSTDPNDLSTSITLLVYTTTSIYAQPSTGSLWANKIYSDGFYKNGSSDNQVLLGGGGSKNLSDFALSGHAHPYLPLSGGTMQNGAVIKFPNSGYIVQNSNSTSNYTAFVKWYKGGVSQAKYDPQIGQYNTGGDGTGSITILPYPTETDPWSGSVGLYISKNTLKIDNKTVLHTGNYTSTLDGRYVNVTGDTMTGALKIVTNGVTFSLNSDNSVFTHYKTSASNGHWFDKNIYIKGDIYAGTNYNQKVWHAGNDGSGSGLDADTLDGKQLSEVRELIGYSWTTRYRINTWSRICSIKNASSILLSLYFTQNNQASLHQYLISTGYAYGNIVQIGANKYTSNYNVKIRLTKSTSTQFYVEIYGTYGYNGATEIGLTCNSVRLHTSGTVTPYTSFTEGGDTLVHEITSATNKIVADLGGNADTATKLQTPRTLWGQSFDGTANVSGNMTNVGSITGSGVLTLIGKTDIQFKRNGADNNSLVLSANTFRPFGAATNLIDLGISTAKWRNIYIGTNAYIDGNTTSSKFIKSGSSNQKVLLGDGSDKNLSDFSMAHSHPYLLLLTISGTTDVNTLKGTRLYYTTSDGGSQNLVNSPFTNTFSMILIANLISGDTDWRRSAIAFNPSGEIKVFNDRGTSGKGGVWYNILTSNNSSVSKSGETLTVKINNVTQTLTNTNTVNTAGATDTSSKIYLIGATSQSASPITYSHNTVYVGTDGCLYSNNTKVSVNGHTHDNIVSRGNVTAESGTTIPAVSGLSMTQVYNNGYPTTYGNVISLKGLGSGELLIGWSGTSGVHAPAYIRSKRDLTTAVWSEWAQIYTTAHKPTPVDIGAATSGHNHDSTYVNITGDTMTGTLNMNNKLYINNSGYIYPYSTSTRTSGMYGIYDSTKIGHIWSMGTGYKIAANGTTFGNLYGFAYKHTNNTTGGTMAGGHMAVWCLNGSPRVALGDYVWAANGFKKNGSSDNYVLLGDGGHKAISDFMLKSDELTNNVITIIKSLDVSTSWMDTGIAGDDLTTGTYILLLYVDDDKSFYSTYHSGVISWYKDNTNDSETDEIILHRAGYAYHKTVYLRTVLTSSGNGGMKLLIAASSDIGASIEYKFKFKRII